MSEKAFVCIKTYPDEESTVLLGSVTVNLVLVRTHRDGTHVGPVHTIRARSVILPIAATESCKQTRGDP